MRILAIDAGNSRIKWGIHEAGAWLSQSWIETANVAQLERVWGEAPKPDTVLATNVAGEKVRDELEGAAQSLGKRIEFVRSRDHQCGVRSSYEDPTQLGPDRWAALIGAWHLRGGPSVVINAGTTMTADALSADGVFLGGVIVPGVDLMRHALAQSTAGLKMEEGSFTFFPDTTADAIMSGAINALAGTVERMQRFMLEAGGAAPRIVISGGAASLIERALNGAAEVMDNLVLEGLLRIALETER